MSGVPKCRRRHRAARAMTLCMALSTAPLAVAQQAGSPPPDRWQFEATPYLWAAGMKGDVGIGQLTAEGINTSFSDIFKSLRFGFMGAFEGRKDRFGFLVDAMYMKLSQTKPAPAPGFGDIHAKPTQQAYTLAGTWRAVEGNVPVDVVGGLRVNDLKLDLDLSSSVLAPQGRTIVRSRSWVDGFVGARVQYPVAPQWNLVGYLDLGGGGSEFTWQWLGGVNYAISPTTTAKFGYRYLKVDYHHDNFLYDVATGGFYASVGMHF